MNITALSALNASPSAVLSPQPPDAQTLNALFTQHSPHFLTTFRFNEADGMPYSHWAQPEAFTALLQQYQQDQYAGFPDKKPEPRALHSLWAQWYFGLLVPPVMLLLLLAPSPIDTRPQNFRVCFHASGRPESFVCFPALPGAAGYPQTSLQRLIGFVEHHLQPVVTRLEQLSGLNGKLNWSNIGYVMHWYLGELKPLIGASLYQQLQHALFFTPHFPDGGVNPLYRTVLLRNGAVQRRTCCQRYKLPKVKSCPDCPLNLT